MYSDIKLNIARLVDTGSTDYLQASLVGIEKESLRVSMEGKIAQTRHPLNLGSALTNQYITTDYSEALTEFITPPMTSIGKALCFLEDLHIFVYQRLEGEKFWATSMPCVVMGESRIPVAEYGKSNLGKMKTVYRNGLGYRYGKTMQTIAGVHFNYSYADKFWSCLYESGDKSVELQEFINEQYFSLIRNLLRTGWIVPYLFGASPAVCRSFFENIKTNLKTFDENTYFEPYATSLRMSDIGYHNKKENENGIQVCYDSLDEYIANLKYAIETPCPEYEKIGVKVNGKYRQLNANILQIENEYYSTVRPKQIVAPNEKPVNALKERGVKYIELRSLDVNAFDPLGINEVQLHFLEAMMLFCLLTDSPDISAMERRDIDYNEMLVALKGRQPGLKIKYKGKDIKLGDWAKNLFSAMVPICELLDSVNNTDKYSRAHGVLYRSVEDSGNTPSAKMLAEMKEKQEAFHFFAKRMSIQHGSYFKQKTLDANSRKMFEEHVSESLIRQKQIESSDEISFDVFMENYYRN
ncbi:MAG TPA: glutamate--cysteine ligase [Gammaproteobacteria bacterium]|nr:glutamate--cysteine ligase [Gammaproteobacteria bacterium]